jgi:transcriptional activator SPT8
LSPFASLLNATFPHIHLEELKLKTEPSENSEATPAPETKLSPVYSIDIQSEGLWALSGLENGSINLVTVRHDEGKCHHVFWKHTGPVSVLTLVPGETSFMSGSWDKTIVVSDYVDPTKYKKKEEE